MTVKMKRLLSLVGAESAQTGWHVRDAGPYDMEYALGLEEPSGTETGKMLASIPSPFARLHVFDAAFAFVSDRRRRHASDTVFHRAASECLDALELLFFWKTLIESGGYPLSIARWDAQGETGRLQDSELAQHQILGDALRLYLDMDGSLEDAKGEMWLLVADVGEERVLAVSSPMTIVAPAPDALTVAQLLGLRVPGEDRLFFEKVCPFEERSAEFRAYVYRLFSDEILSRECKHLAAFVENVRRGSQDLQELKKYENANYVELEEGGRPLSVHGVSQRCSSVRAVPDRVLRSPRRIKADRSEVDRPPLFLIDGVDIDGRTKAEFKAPSRPPGTITERVLPEPRCPYPFLIADDLFEDCVIKLPFGLNNDSFCLPSQSAAVVTAFLPPLRREYYHYFSESQVSARLRYEPIPGGVRCLLSVPLQDGRSVEVHKNYFAEPTGAGAGRVIEANFDLALFPSAAWRTNSAVRQTSSDECVVGLVELTSRSSNRKRSKIAFYRYETNGPLVTPLPQSVDERERTPPQFDYSSQYFTLKAWVPELIELTVEDGPHTAKSVVGVAVTESTNSGRQFVAAVDFGTTNTHLAMTEVLQKGTTPHEMTLFDTHNRRSAVTTLHNPAEKGGSMILASMEQALWHEFVPPGDASQQLFPTRTAIAERPGSEAEKLFGDANVAFFLYRESLRSPRFERVTTHLKWAKESDVATAKRLRLYFRELLILIKTEILLNGGDPSKCQLVWFWPLSFTEYLRRTLNSVWQEESSTVLGIGPKNVMSLTESAAPYYYYEASAKTTTRKPVLGIDIGGGSTDIVIFKDKNPEYGTSFNFAGGSLWGAGFNLVNETPELSGVATLVRGLLKKFENRAQGDPESLRRFKSATQGFDDSKELSTSEEVVNLGFKTDEFIQLTETLKTHAVPRAMVVLQFAAIVFHCARLMLALKLEKPEVISLSGNGTRALSIADSSAERDALGEFAADIFRVVYDQQKVLDSLTGRSLAQDVEQLQSALGAKRSTPVRLLVASKLKESTCEGGLYWLTSGEANRKSEPKPMVMMSDPASVVERQKAPQYKSIDEAEIKSAAREYRRFVALFTACGDRTERLFNLPARTRERIAPILWDNVEELIDTGLRRRLLSSDGESERAVETFLFYPLIQQLYQISRLLDER